MSRKADWDDTFCRFIDTTTKIITAAIVVHVVDVYSTIHAAACATSLLYGSLISSVWIGAYINGKRNTVPKKPYQNGWVLKKRWPEALAALAPLDDCWMAPPVPPPMMAIAAV